MNFDTVILAAVTHQLTEAALGARIDKVTQPEPLELVFSLYKGGYKANLLVSADPNSARTHLIRARGRPNPLTPPAFCMLLRKYLDGAVVIQVTQPFGFCERVLKISARTASRESVHLWIEVMGRQSNVVLTNDAGLILGSIKRVTSEMSRFREVRSGIPYTPPPRQLGHKRDPMESLSSFGLPTEPFDSRDEEEKWLTATFRGVGSLLAKESILRSPTAPATGESAWYGLNELLNIVRLADFNPVVYSDGEGRILGAYPFPLKSVPELQQTAAPSISEALEQAYGSQLHEDALEKERSALAAALRRALKTTERQLIDVNEGLVNSEQSEYLRENGELLLANIGKQPAGSTEITVDDYFTAEQGAQRTIPLDSKLTVHENAERLFRRYQKARDSKDVLLARKSVLESSEIEIQKAISGVETAETSRELQSLTERLSSEIPQTQTTGEREAAQRPSYDGHKIKSMKTPDGWEILVGENSTSNDYLTTKVASPSDIWFHARAVPSAHAVIRAQNRPGSVSTAAILLAAEQVAKRSQAKHAGLVSIDYTLKKYVRKPRGSAPGQVTYTNEKTIDVIASDE